MGIFFTPSLLYKIRNIKKFSIYKSINNKQKHDNNKNKKQKKIKLVIPSYLNIHNKKLNDNKNFDYYYCPLPMSLPLTRYRTADNLYIQHQYTR